MGTYDVLGVGIIIIASGCAGFFGKDRGVMRKIGIGLLTGLPLFGILFLTMHLQLDR